MAVNGPVPQPKAALTSIFRRLSRRSPIGLDGRDVTWSAGGAWGAIALKPASRPRRLARRIVTDLAERLAAHPRFADFLRQRLGKFPRLRNRLRTAVRNERRIRLGYLPPSLLVSPEAVTDADMAGEMEGVRDLYRRLVAMRQQVSGDFTAP